MVSEDEVPTGADVLFQNNSIGEIVEIRQKILQDITKKNQDVRILVSERYRDLIDAADTIQNMKKLVDELPSKLEKLPASCGNFKPRQIAVKSEGTEKFSRYAQTKLILDITANIGNLIEMRQLIASAALVSLAQLALRDHNLPEPVLKSCQSSLKSATLSLNKACRSAMADPSCSESLLSEAVCTLSILEGLKPQALIEVFFSERSSALNLILDSQTANTKDKFRTVALYIIDTLALADCFHGRFLTHFKSHQVNSGIVSLVEDPLSLATKFLPQHLLDFKCLLPDSLLNTDLSSTVNSQGDSFKESMKLNCRTKLLVELQCLTEVSGVTRTFSHLMECLAERDPAQTIYASFFRDSIVTRIAEIFEEILSGATERLLTAVHGRFADAARVKSSNIPSLCSDFDSVIKSALDQLQGFPPYNDVASEEHRSLQSLIGASTDGKLTRVCAFVTQCIESGVRCCHFLSVLSHLMLNLTECENLQRILGSGWTQRRVKLLETRDSSSATALKTLIDEGLVDFKRVLGDSPKGLMMKFSSAKALVEVSTDEDSLKATLTVPQHCLLPLSDLLFRICVDIKDTLECSVSTKVIASSNRILLTSVEQVYQDLLDRRAGMPAALLLDLAIQLLFDLGYLERLLGLEGDQKLREEIISLIDPVEYHTIEGHLTEFVLGLMAQTAMLYGLICPQGFLGKARKQASQEHNVMLMAKQSIERFSLLPVGLPSLRRS